MANRPTHTTYHAPTPGFANHASLQQIFDVAQRGVVRALGNAHLFAAGELALKALKQAVESFQLHLVRGAWWLRVAKNVHSSVWRQACGATGRGAVQALFKARSALDDFIYSVDIAILLNQLSNSKRPLTVQHWPRWWSDSRGRGGFVDRCTHIHPSEQREHQAR